jgi:hypothetical protein
VVNKYQIRLLVCWFIIWLVRLLFGMLLVSWLGCVLENCFIGRSTVRHLVVFLILQRPGDTEKIGNNNKHCGQKLTFKFPVFTEATPLLPKEIQVSHNRGEGLSLVGYYVMSTCSS